MSESNTTVTAPTELPGGLGERVARLIEPEAWQAFDTRAFRKGWGPAERRMELIEEIGRGRRLANSCERARAVLALIAEESPILELGVEDEVAAPLGSFKLCPLCLKANPCDRHSLAQQIRALDDPEYLNGRPNETAAVAIPPDGVWYPNHGLPPALPEQRVVIRRRDRSEQFGPVGGYSWAFTSPPRPDDIMEFMLLPTDMTARACGDGGPCDLDDRT